MKIAAKLILPGNIRKQIIQIHDHIGIELTPKASEITQLLTLKDTLDDDNVRGEASEFVEGEKIVGNQRIGYSCPGDTLRRVAKAIPTTSVIIGRVNKHERKRHDYHLRRRVSRPRTSSTTTTKTKRPTTVTIEAWSKRRHARMYTRAWTTAEPTTCASQVTLMGEDLVPDSLQSE
ncbi:hypothetical protein BAE30_06090 [Acidithiobacillus caldus]|uniref:Uncharacterized protein n=1 Tax=Acidithiobacillus caldus TaxID=33059 RepID=A0A1E7YX19_9PROT|nr:hypothetical protein BAE30_06090 [Acidithiobacillus caldus]